MKFLEKKKLKIWDSNQDFFITDDEVCVFETAGMNTSIE